MTIDTGGLIKRVMVDAAVVAIFIIFQGLFWDAGDLGIVLWYVMFLGLIVTPWLEWVVRTKLHRGP